MAHIQGGEGAAVGSEDIGRIDHRDIMVQNISRMMDRRTGDVVINVGEHGEPFQVHGILFAAASTVFEKLLYGGMVESQSGQVSLPDLSTPTFEVLRQYVYTGITSLSAENVVDVLVASRQFGLDPLLDACLEHVSGSLDTDNVWSLLVMADIYDLPTLKERCFRFIGTRATLVLQSEAALEVPESVMAELVKREDLCAPEISIFEVVQRWSMARDGDPMAAATGDLGGGGGSFDKGRGGGGAAQTTTPPTPPPPPPPLPPLSSERNRREAAMEITKHLRLPLISLRDLMKLVRPSGLVEVNQLMEAVDYHSDPASHAEKMNGGTGARCYQKRDTSTVKSSYQVWHQDVHGPQITISNGGKTVYQASSNWNGVVATSELKDGIHKVSVRIDSMVYMGNIWQAVFGVAHPSACASIVSEAAFKDISGLVIGTGDKTSAGSIHAEPFTVPLKQGSTISLVYDTAHGSLEFFRDGTSLGVAYKDGIKGPVVPALAIASNCAFTLCD